MNQMNDVIDNKMICPISKTIMTDPVIAQDGHTYERSAIVEHFKTSNLSCVTNEIIGKTLLNDHATRDLLKMNNYPVASIDNTIDITKRRENSGIKITLVLDVSGSMSESVENKRTNESSFSRLDLIKHSAISIAKMMLPDDQLCIITFSDTSRILIPFTNASEINEEIIKTIDIEGSTDIPRGLLKGIEQNGDYTILLTDGENRIDPPRGTLEEYINNIIKDYTGVIHTVGLGMSSDLDTETLYKVSKKNRGMYHFCPDATMVGTVFIHMIANIYTSVFTVNEDPEDLEYDPEYNTFVYLLKNVYEKRSAGKIGEAFNLVKRAQFENKEYADEMYSNDKNKGQVSKSIGNWDTWGKHYLLALIDAHDHKKTTNFKDASVQKYANDTTRSLINRGEDIFLKVDPPVPSCNNRRQNRYDNSQFTMATMSATGICFSPYTLIMLANGSLISAKNIKRGMVLTHGRVLCVVISPLANMVKLDEGVIVSNNHPVYSNKGWVHAKDFNSEDAGLHVCYNFVLDTGHIVQLGLKRYEAVTLGHGFKGDVVGHDYLGTQAVVDDIFKMNNKDDGLDDGIVYISGYERNNNGIYKLIELR